MSLKEKDFLDITKMKWCSPIVFDDAIAAKAISRRTVVVPTLVGEPGFECLRVKIINQREYALLNSLQSQPGKKGLFEKVKSPCDGYYFFFGWEPEDLNHKHAPGILVSYWARDPKVTKLQLSYEFGVTCLGAFGEGFGGRGSVPSYGMNVYFKPEGKGTRWTTDSPAQDPEDREHQQYFKASLLESAHGALGKKEAE